MYPKEYSKEQEFKRDVKIFLFTDGHRLLKPRENTTKLKHNQYIDLVSEKDGITYFTELKIKDDNPSLQRSIGQIIMHKFYNEYYNNDENIVYQIAFPLYLKHSHDTYFDLYNYLDEKYHIKVIFI
jgi:hypothetical protein